MTNKGKIRNMLENLIMQIEDDLEDSKKDIITDVKNARYTLGLLIKDLEEDRIYRDNVPHETVARLSRQYAVYADKQKTVKLIRQKIGDQNDN